jgi:hypothetical protein
MAQICEALDKKGLDIDGDTVKSAQLMQAQMEHYNLEAFPQYVAGMHIKFPKDYDVPPLVMTLYEETDFSALKYIQKWRRKIIDNDGNYGIPKDYKKDLTVVINDLEGGDAISVTYIGCFPTHVMGYQLDSGIGHFLMTIVNFSVDKVRLTGDVGTSPNIDVELEPIPGSEIQPGKNPGGGSSDTPGLGGDEPTDEPPPLTIRPRKG